MDIAGTAETATDDRTPWWRGAVFYQVYPRSFADSDGDGVGDLRGIIDHADHLVALGVDAVWLSPFYRSPMRDFGYDISDHCSIDPVFGSMDDFDDLVVALHDRGLRLIVDFVPNHTSSDHPWFVSSRSSRDDPKRDWYIWADPAPDGGPPTNWTASFTDGPAWDLDPVTGQYYLHLFLSEQPDLNWANPEVEAAQHEVLRFWMDRGVDGFRIDVINAIGKDPNPRDVPDHLVGLPHVVLTHHDTALPLIRRIRATVDPDLGADPETCRFIVGEVVTGDLTVQAGYAGSGDGICCPVNFASVWAPWDRDAWRSLIEQVEAAYPSTGPNWPSYVLSNHDNPRHATRFGARADRARAAAVLLLTLRGTPFLYQGEELGLLDAVVTADRIVDPGGRDGCRAPIPWTDAEDHGWGPRAWLPFPPDAAAAAASVQASQPGSMLWLYRAVLQARRLSPALRTGALTLLDSDDGVLSFERSAPGQAMTVHVNFADEPAAVAAGGIVVVSSGDVPADDDFDGVVAGATAVVVRR